MSRIALIAGLGGLPAALVAAMEPPPLVCALAGFAPEGVAVDVTFRVERLAVFWRHIEDLGVGRVIFAGAVRRPSLDPALFDPETAALLPRLLEGLQGGDDALLRGVLALFEAAGFAVLGVGDVAPGLLPGEGVLAGACGPGDMADASRAAEIVAALGALDLGQGAVVAQGLCLAVEALPGTDAMLEAVAALPATLRPDPAQGRGLLYKAAKPGQDRRIDQPVIGVATLRLAARAGLAGVAFQAGEVICLDLPAMQAEARALGLFLWARA